VPQSRYRASPVAFAATLALPNYYASDLVRRVHADGAASLNGWRVKLSQAFAGLDMAFRPTCTDGVWRAYFMRFLIAEVDLRGQTGKTAAVRKVSDRSSGSVTA
jgi:hypothetical protein